MKITKEQLKHVIKDVIEEDSALREKYRNNWRKKIVEAVIDQGYAKEDEVVFHDIDGTEYDLGDWYIKNFDVPAMEDEFGDMEPFEIIEKWIQDAESEDAFIKQHIVNGKKLLEEEYEYRDIDDAISMTPKKMLTEAIYDVYDETTEAGFTKEQVSKWLHSRVDATLDKFFD